MTTPEPEAAACGYRLHSTDLVTGVTRVLDPDWATPAAARGQARQAEGDGAMALWSVHYDGMLPVNSDAFIIHFADRFGLIRYFKYVSMDLEWESAPRLDKAAIFPREESGYIVECLNDCRGENRLVGRGFTAFRAADRGVRGFTARCARVGMAGEPPPLP